MSQENDSPFQLVLASWWVTRDACCHGNPMNPMTQVGPDQRGKAFWAVRLDLPESSEELERKEEGGWQEREIKEEESRKKRECVSMCVCLNRDWRFARGGELHQYRSFWGQDTWERLERKPLGKPVPQPHAKAQAGMGWGWQGLNLAYVAMVVIRFTVNKTYLSSTNSSQELL